MLSVCQSVCLLSLACSPVSSSSTVVVLYCVIVVDYYVLFCSDADGCSNIGEVLGLFYLLLLCYLGIVCVGLCYISIVQLFFIFITLLFL